MLVLELRHDDAGSWILHGLRCAGEAVRRLFALFPLQGSKAPLCHLRLVRLGRCHPPWRYSKRRRWVRCLFTRSMRNENETPRVIPSLRKDYSGTCVASGEVHGKRLGRNGTCPHSTQKLILLLRAPFLLTAWIDSNQRGSDLPCLKTAFLQLVRYVTLKQEFTESPVRESGETVFYNPENVIFSTPGHVIIEAASSQSSFPSSFCCRSTTASCSLVLDGLLSYHPLAASSDPSTPSPWIASFQVNRIVASEVLSNARSLALPKESRFLRIHPIETIRIY